MTVETIARLRSAVVAMIGAMLLFAPTAVAATPPTIVPISAKQVSSSEEVVEVEVNTQGLASRYAIELVAVTDPNEPNMFASRLPHEAQSVLGQIPAGSGVTEETATFKELELGRDYFYRVFAYNKPGGETQEEQVYSFGFGTEDAHDKYIPNLPYTPRVSLWSIELAEEESAQDVKEYNEKQARLANEREQQLSLEREQVATAEARTRQTNEQNISNRPQPTRQCIVPSLYKESLHRAEQASKASDCAIGRVSRPRSRGHGKLVVLQQSHRRGERLPSGTKIAVVLGWRTHH